MPYFKIIDPAIANRIIDDYLHLDRSIFSIWGCKEASPGSSYHCDLPDGHPDFHISYWSRLDEDHPVEIWGDIPQELLVVLRLL